MKIRTDYVSNSSSSSFIIADNEMFDHFNIKRKDIYNALKALMSPENFKYCYLYDMRNERDIKRINKIEWPLNDWSCNMCYVDNTTGRLTWDYGDKVSEWEKFKNSIEHAHHLYVEDYGDLDKAELRIPQYDENGLYIDEKIEPIPDWLKKTIKETRKKLGVLTNWEAAHRPEARYVIHFGDNEVNTIEGINVRGKCEDLERPWQENGELTDYQKEVNEEIRTSTWETECYTIDRLCEVLVKYWIKIGKIDPNDVFFKVADTNPMAEMFENIISYCWHEG